MAIVSRMAAKKNQTSSRKKSSRSRKNRKRGSMVFQRKNYTLLFACLALITFGYVIMRMENEVDGFISLYIAPLILLAGYLGVIYAIMWRPSEKEDSSA